MYDELKLGYKHVDGVKCIKVDERLGCWKDPFPVFRASVKHLINTFMKVAGIVPETGPDYLSMPDEGCSCNIEPHVFVVPHPLSLCSVLGRPLNIFIDEDGTLCKVSVDIAKASFFCLRLKIAELCVAAIYQNY